MCTGIKVDMKTLGIMGGSGLVTPAELAASEIDTETPWGAASGPISNGQIAGCSVLFMPRHGLPRTLAPHQVNYRANLWKMRQQGAEAILALSCVGAINRTLAPGDLVIPDQLIDYTHGRAQSFAETESRHTGHFDFSQPFDEELRTALVRAVQESRGTDGYADVGVYGVTQGPRFETAAEIERMARDGCDLVGMTLMPEAALARQLGLRYTVLCPVVNMAAGHGDGPLDVEVLLTLMASMEPELQGIVRRTIEIGIQCASE